MPDASNWKFNRASRTGSNRPVKRPAAARSYVGSVEALETRRLLSSALLKDVNADYVGAPSDPKYLTDAAGTLYFTANGGAAGQGLFRSDGTTPGTQLLVPIAGGDDFVQSSLTALGNNLFFVRGSTLWHTDGTVAGSKPLTTLSPSGNELAQLNGKLLAIPNSNNATSMTLWTSDGTEAGTVPLKQFAEAPMSPKVHGLVKVGSNLFFLVFTTGNDAELWKTDGSLAGTVLVRNFHDNGTAPSKLMNFNGTLYLLANGDASGNVLWKSDGTDAGTVKVLDNNGSTMPAAAPLVVVGNTLYLLKGGSDRTIYRTDGTAANTKRVADIFPSLSLQTTVGAGVGTSSLVYINTDGRNDGQSVGAEPFIFDGATAHLLSNINPTLNAGSSPDNFTTVGSSLFFTANNGSIGVETYRTDGTNTVLADDTFPGVNGSSPHSLTSVGGTLLFVGDDFAAGTEIHSIATADSTPMGLLAQAISPTQINLTWGFPGPTPASFELQRSLDGVTFGASIPISGGIQGSYSDAGRSPSTTYFYRVRAIASGGRAHAVVGNGVDHHGRHDSRCAGPANCRGDQWHDRFDPARLARQLDQ